jgi:hypothetical protein
MSLPPPVLSRRQPNNSLLLLLLLPHKMSRPSHLHINSSAEKFLSKTIQDETSGRLFRPSSLLALTLYHYAKFMNEPKNSEFNLGYKNLNH